MQGLRRLIRDLTRAKQPVFSTTPLGQPALTMPDGSLRPFSGRIYQIVNDVVAPADTNENIILTSPTIPGNTLGPKDALIVDIGMSCDNNANSKTLRFRLNGVQIVATNSLTSTAGGKGNWVLQNRNSQTSQVYTPSCGLSFGAGVGQATSAVDFTVDQVFTITIQKATAGDAIVLNHARMYIDRGV